MQQAENFCQFWLDRGSLLEIEAITEKSDALGKYFDSVFHLKVASKLQEEKKKRYFISLQKAGCLLV